jgi:DNA polymerase III, epsilon subunit and related 3''-5'' exonucleases
MEFIALDFETANQRIDSICQIGAVKFRAGKVVDTYNMLVKPAPFYFDAINISIHGITALDVTNAADFATLWKESFLPFIDNQKIICHNAGFDMNVLFSTLTKLDLSLPSIEYMCSLALARKFIKEQPTYSLGPLVKNILQYQFKHHDALDDAMACGQLYQYLIDNYDVCSYVEKEYVIGTFANNTHTLFHKKGYTPKKSRPKPVVEHISNNLQGISFCFTGKLSKARRIFESHVIAHGAKALDYIDEQTDFLIVGNYSARFGENYVSSKERMALTFNENGSEIKIIDEQTFVEFMMSFGCVI